MRHDFRVLSPGRRCVSATRFHHRFQGRLDSASGPLEFVWDDGAATSFDIASDWTLKIVDGSWPDPFAGQPEDKLRELEAEVGIWVVASADERLRSVVGQTLQSAEPERNEAGELSGVRLVFDGLTVRAFGWDGELHVETE